MNAGASLEVLASEAEFQDLSRSAARRDVSLPYLRRRGRGLLRIVLPLALLVVWEIGSATKVISEETLPSPATVVAQFHQLIATGQLQAALGISLRRAALGLLFGFAVGAGFGLLNGASRLGEEIFDSTMQMFRMIPFLAIIPLLIVWFGIGETAKVVLIAFACVFPAYINTYAAVRSIDPKLIEAARVFGLRGRKLARTVILPNALPGVLVGLRYSMGVSILALIAAEEINANSGLGYLVSVAQTALNNNVIVALVIVYGVLGLLIDAIVRVLEAVLLPWRPSGVRK
ncbi:MAG: ABC transporter permease subunit [Solirubrobacteraceae bacterium]